MTSEWISLLKSLILIQLPEAEKKKKSYTLAKINSLLPSKMFPVSLLSVLEKQSFGVYMESGLLLVFFCLEDLRKNMQIHRLFVIPSVGMASLPPQLRVLATSVARAKHVCRSLHEPVRRQGQPTSSTDLSGRCEDHSGKEQPKLLWWEPDA